jgi:hypothetical protein
MLVRYLTVCVVVHQPICHSVGMMGCHFYHQLNQRFGWWLHLHWPIACLPEKMSLEVVNFDISI